MQKLEYLQLSINYYSAEDQRIIFSNNEAPDVWKDLHDFLATLDKQGWEVINETKSDRGQFRTYHLKKPVE